MVGKLFCLFALAATPSLLGAVNPFESHLGVYRAVAAVCHENGIEYEDGCLPDEITIEALGANTFRLTEKVPAPFTTHSQTMDERKVDTAALKSESRFSSVSKRNARWTFVSLETTTKREEHVAVELESSKDGLELSFRRALSERGGNLTQARTYFIEPAN